jgi:hypothetical protein
LKKKGGVFLAGTRGRRWYPCQIGGLKIWPGDTIILSVVDGKCVYEKIDGGNTGYQFKASKADLKPQVPKKRFVRKEIIEKIDDEPQPPELRNISKRLFGIKAPKPIKGKKPKNQATNDWSAHYL